MDSDKIINAKAALHGANTCAEHATNLEWDDIAEVVGAFSGCYHAWEGNNDCRSYCDYRSNAVVQLKDGRFASIWEDSDTSGHG